MLPPNSWKPFSLTHVTYPVLHSPGFHQRHVPRLLALLSLTPPFGVCALVTASLIYKDAVAAYLLAGSLLATSISALLKRGMRQPRPPRYDDDEDGVDYGMPSNHACFAWFCAAFVILCVTRGRRRGALPALPRASSPSAISDNPSAKNECHRDASVGSDRLPLVASSLAVRTWHFLHTGFVIGASLLIAVGCAYSRIYLGYHTPRQVCAGSVFGAMFAVLWYSLLETSDVVRRLMMSLGWTINGLERARWKEWANDGVEKKD